MPDADIVYDHFHVIKLMNERMDKLRRITINTLCAEQKKQLKNKRWLLLRNVENLSTEAKGELEQRRGEF
ncbi:MAG: transposase, partial [Pontiella sp.]